MQNFRNEMCGFLGSFFASKCVFPRKQRICALSFVVPSLLRNETCRLCNVAYQHFFPDLLMTSDSQKLDKCISMQQVSCHKASQNQRFSVVQITPLVQSPLKKVACLSFIDFSSKRSSRLFWQIVNAQYCVSSPNKLAGFSENL